MSRRCGVVVVVVRLVHVSRALVACSLACDPWRCWKICACILTRSGGGVRMFVTRIEPTSRWCRRFLGRSKSEETVSQLANGCRTFRGRTQSWPCINKGVELSSDAAIPSLRWSLLYTTQVRFSDRCVKKKKDEREEGEDVWIWGTCFIYVFIYLFIYLFICSSIEVQ